MSDAVKPNAVSAAAKATTAPFRALALLLKNPKLWPYAIVPTLIAFVLLIGLAVGAYYGHGWMVSLIADAPTGEEWGVWYYTAWWLMALALALGVPVLSALLAPALCEPFLGAFARRVRALVTGEMPAPPSGLYADFIAPVVHLGLRLGFLAAVHLVLLVLWLIPG
ncbi:MAG: EI24 domain-containing protein, partial [Planctomycetota bacterium]